LRSPAEASAAALAESNLKGREGAGRECSRRVAKFGFGYESARLLDIARRVQSAAIETDSQIARAFIWSLGGDDLPAFQCSRLEARK
jgi:hypothetical protein